MNFLVLLIFYISSFFKFFLISIAWNLLRQPLQLLKPVMVSCFRLLVQSNTNLLRPRYNLSFPLGFVFLHLGFKGTSLALFWAIYFFPLTLRLVIFVFGNFFSALLTAGSVANFGCSPPGLKVRELKVKVRIELATLASLLRLETFLSSLLFYSLLSFWQYWCWQRRWSFHPS